MGGIIHVTLLLQLLMLLVVANGAAVAAKKLLGAKFARPLDGGALTVENLGEMMMIYSARSDLQAGPWGNARGHRGS